MKQRLIQIVKSLLGIAEYTFRPWNYASDELIVLCMHSTPGDRMQSFERILDFVFKHFKALDPKQLGDYFEGNLMDGPNVLFTFDDGLKNNRHAAQLLEKRNARAVFFVVPDFIEAADGENYYRQFIRQTIDAAVDHEREDFTPLSYSELKDLLERGHCVESHTMTHGLRATDQTEDAERELVQSKVSIGKNVGLTPTMFCSPVQTNLSVSSFAKRRISEEYAFHFTTFPALHATMKNPQLIFRRNIEVHWSMGQIKYALGKADLARWKGEISRFQQL